MKKTIKIVVSLLVLAGVYFGYQASSSYFSDVAKQNKDIVEGNGDITYSFWPDDDVRNIEVEKITLKEVAQKFSSPIYFPVYVPSGYKPNEDLKLASKTGSEVSRGSNEILMYEWISINDKMKTIYFVSESKQLDNGGCSDRRARKESINSGVACFDAPRDGDYSFKGGWISPGGTTIRVTTRSSEEDVRKVIESLEIINP